MWSPSVTGSEASSAASYGQVRRRPPEPAPGQCHISYQTMPPGASRGGRHCQVDIQAPPRCSPVQCRLCIFARQRVQVHAGSVGDPRAYREWRGWPLRDSRYTW